MNPTASRGRLILMIAVGLLIVERLAITCLALASFNEPKFNWTSVILPITHIAVVLFLVYTSDMLIYWLVIMWGIITTGHFSWLFWLASANDKSGDFAKNLAKNWILIALVLFHFLITVAFLWPWVREYLAHQRSKLDFEDLPPSSSTSDSETKKIV